MKLGGRGSLIDSLPNYLGLVTTLLSSSKIQTFQPGAGIVQEPGFSSKVCKFL